MRSSTVIRMLSLLESVHHLLLLLLVLITTNGKSGVHIVNGYTRADFPPPTQFVFGAGTSAYQVEGAAFEDGRTASIFDTFAHAGYSNGDNADVASDGYHKYKEDVQLMVDTGLEGYRFSISWSRLIPNGRGPINLKGIQYYNNFIDQLISHGIQPHITLCHSDLPQVLEDEYGGWLSRNAVKDFVAYADVCFREFGDRVSHWTTFNEANIYVSAGYDQGYTQPTRCSSPFGARNCTRGNSSTEPYIVAHNILLAHASAARLYQKKYKARQHGLIGIGIFSFGFVPYTNSTEDLIATQRAYEFDIGWFVNPLVFGDYPEIMRQNAGTRLPTFTQWESTQVKGSFDFLAVNHYLTLTVKDKSSNLLTDNRDYSADMAIEQIFEGANSSQHPYPINPSGLQGVLEHFKRVYGNPPIYIHENGQQIKRDGNLNDTERVEYLHGYIGSVLDAIRNGSNARGYFCWSFIDVFEPLDGYDRAFGLYYVDRDDKDLRRYPKLSAHWYSSFLKGRQVTHDELVFKLSENKSDSSQFLATIPFTTQNA